MRAFLRLLGFLLPFWKDALLAFALGLAALAAAVGLLGTSTDLLARAALRPSIADLQVAIVGVRFFGLSRAVFRYLERLASHQANFKLLGGVRRWLLRTIYQLPAERLEQQTGADLLARTLEDVDTLDQFFVRALAPFLTAFSATLGMGLFLGGYAPLLGWLVVLGMGIACLLVPALTVRATRRNERGLTHLRTAYLEDTQEMLAFVDHWRMFGRKEPRLVQWSEAARGYAAVASRQRSISAAGDAAAGAAAGLTGLAVLAAAGWLSAQEMLPGTRIAVAAVLAMAVFEAANPVNAAAGWLRACLEAGERVLALGRAPGFDSEVAEPDMSTPQTSSELRIVNISYQYPSANSHSIQKVSLTVKPGEWVGICGPNGSGKSTLLRLVGDELPPGAGRIDRAGGSGPMTVSSLLVSQPYVFSTSLAANLRLADQHAEDGRLWEALEWVELDSWAHGFPEGLNTWLGGQGWRLSAGQRQRLALARLYLQDRPLLLLDEPLAHLDASGAKRMQARLLAWARKKTVLWVSHQLADFDCFDQVLVLQAGQVIQQGHPKDLARVAGWYRSQRRAQVDLDMQP